MDPQTQPEQAPAPSVTDRIANIFGEQEAPQETQPEQPTASEAPEETPQETAPVSDTFELEVEGEKFVLPKKLEKGFMQERDYTQKSQTVAEQRRALEHVQEQARIAQMRDQFSQEVSGELQQLQFLDAIIKQSQSTDWSAMSTDELIRKRLDLDGYREQRHALVQAIEGKRQSWEQKQQAELDTIRAKSLEILQKRIPGWNNDLAKAVREHALTEGYTEAELSSIIDPRHATTLWKAAQYDKLQANAKPVVQNAKVVKTTPSNPMPQETKEFLNYRKALSKAPQGSIERKRAVEDRIAAKFGR